jgi:hypothetical protein
VEYAAMHWYLMSRTYARTYATKIPTPSGPEEMMPA